MAYPGYSSLNLMKALATQIQIGRQQGPLLSHQQGPLTNYRVHMKRITPVIALIITAVIVKLLLQ